MNLVLLACLIGAPATCHEERLQIAALSTTPMACLNAAQPAIAEWREEHPEFMAARWRCEPLDRRARR